MLRGFEQNIVSHRLLPEVIRAWRKPAFEEFETRTLWSLENAFTTALTSVARTGRSGEVTAGGGSRRGSAAADPGP